MFSLFIFFVLLFGSWGLCKKFRKQLDVSSNVLFVTAHPDDEIMFFGPTLFEELQARLSSTVYGIKTKVHLLCLSTGNFYGDGKQRSQELKKACDFLLRSINLNPPKDLFSVEIVDDLRLPDSPVIEWNFEAIQEYVERYVKRNDIGKVITFDEHGISGHSNHIAISKCLHRSLSSSVDLWQLQSVCLFRKYLSVFDMLFTLVQCSIQHNWDVTFVSLWNYLNLVQALRQHNSQMLWFRYLYSSTSRYMFINCLHKRKRND